MRSRAEAFWEMMEAVKAEKVEIYDKGKRAACDAIRERLLKWAEVQQDRCGDADHWPTITDDCKEILNIVEVELGIVDPVMVTED